MNSVARAVSTLSRVLPSRPPLAIVLGSGFQSTLEKAEVLTQIAFNKLPGFSAPTVAGHSGKLLLVRFNGIPVIALSGRSHFYEGYSMEEVTFSVRVLAALGVKALLLTNAAGGINPKFQVGDFMAVSDHINFMGTNPLRGVHCEDQTRFVDLTEVYDRGLANILKKVARRSKIRLHSGTYIAVSGPTYETPAEIRAFAKLGAEAVGMSTVPEAIVARQCGLRVAALSCITNLAAGRSRKRLSHADVLAMGNKVRAQINQLLAGFLQLYSAETSPPQA